MFDPYIKTIIKLSKSKDLYSNLLLSSSYTSWGVIMDDKPNQSGNFKFPKRSFGQRNLELRAFNPQWFTQSPWLHYDEVFIIQTVFTIYVLSLTPAGT